jgi:hypothetical protein
MHVHHRIISKPARQILLPTLRPFSSPSTPTLTGLLAEPTHHPALALLTSYLEAPSSTQVDPTVALSVLRRVSSAFPLDRHETALFSRMSRLRGGSVDVDKREFMVRVPTDQVVSHPGVKKLLEVLTDKF